MPSKKKTRKFREAHSRIAAAGLSLGPTKLRAPLAAKRAKRPALPQGGVIKLRWLGINFVMPAEGGRKPGLYAGRARVLPLLRPHRFNEKREDALFQMPNWLRTFGLNRDPDFTIGGRADPYLYRWWIVPRNRFFGVYLHRFIRSDDDRALHDHPWINASILLRGCYIEEVPDLRNMRTPYMRLSGLARRRLPRWPWCIVFRRAIDAHRIELLDGQRVYSLFFTGPIIRPWGFHCTQGWVHWKSFVGDDPGSIGRGCEQESPSA